LLQLRGLFQLKETASGDNYFLRSKHFNDGFQCLSKSFSLLYTIINFLFASLKLLTNFENAISETLLRIPFSVIGRYSSMSASHWLQDKCARINLSQATSGKILLNHRRLSVSVKIAVIGSVQRGIFKISKLFHRHKLKFLV
jgi:hypothetical protein